MVGINSDNSSILQARYTDKSQSGIVKLDFSEENGDPSYLSQLFNKKLIALLGLLTAGLLMAILLFTIHTMITVQNIDMFIKLHYKIPKSKPMTETTSKTSQECGFTTEAIPNDFPLKSTVKRQVLQIVTREQWNAELPTDVMELIVPVDTIIISHTATQNCNTSTACEKLIKSIQRYHIEEKHWSDIAYNFVVGGDGKVYEGRGWTSVGSHTSGYNMKSLGIALTGDFENKIPHKAQIEACKELIKMGVKLGYINKNYKLFGASQFVSTTSPGKALLKEMETWPQFFEKV